MKRAKLIKAIVLILALAILSSAALIVAGAEGTETPSVEITLKNVSYDSEITVMFAVDHTKAGEGAEIELLYYLEDPEVNPEAKSYKG